jgi:hypothetical protein
MRKKVPSKVLAVMQNLSEHYSITLTLRPLRFKDAAGIKHPGYALSTPDPRFARTSFNTWPAALGQPAEYEIATFEKMPHGIWYVKIWELESNPLYAPKYMGPLYVVKPLKTKIHVG